MQKGDELILKVESLSGNKKTVAHYENFVVFIEDAIPGDTVRAKIWKITKRYAEARAIEILISSPHRVIHKCKHFGVCGGCRWQNLSYEAQLNFKQCLVRDAFTHIGGFQSPEVQPVIGCDYPFFYRNKMEFTFSNYRWLTSEEMQNNLEQEPEVAVGLHIPQRFDKVLNIEECYLQSEISMAILNSVREIVKGWNLTVYSTKIHEGYLRHLVIRDGKKTGELMVNVVTTYEWQEVMQNLTKLLLKYFPEITTIVNNVTARKSMVAFGDSEKVYHGTGVITEKLGDFTFHISANSFFQTNTYQAEKLYNVAKQLASLKPSDVVYDLYSGTGTITIFLSDAAERVIGIEVIESAIRDAERNADANRITNCFFLQGDLKDRLTKDNSWLQEHPKPNVVVADPPRSGIHPKVIEKIINLAPEKVVYISCNPATQARDAKLLVDGGYSLKTIQPVDMFPHTDHIESVVLFTR